MAVIKNIKKLSGKQILMGLSFSSMIFLASCATLTRGTTQNVNVVTPGAPGAMCTLTSQAIGTRTVKTPGNITLEKSQHAISVTCTKKCFVDGVGTIASTAEGMAAGNIVFGGLVGLGIDAASGALNKYSPTVQIPMTRKPGCR